MGSLVAAKPLVLSVVAMPANEARRLQRRQQASDEVGMASNYHQRCRENECRVGNGMGESGADERFSSWTTNPRTIGPRSSQYYLSLALAQ